MCLILRLNFFLHLLTLKIFRFVSAWWHWVPDPRGNIAPTYEECTGFQWVHTPSLYFTMRELLDDKGNGFPEKLIPLHPCKPKDKLTHIEFKRRLLKNVRAKKKGISPLTKTSHSCDPRTGFGVDKLPRTPKKSRLC